MGFKHLLMPRERITVEVEQKGVVTIDVDKAQPRSVYIRGGKVTCERIEKPPRPKKKRLTHPRQ